MKFLACAQPRPFFLVFDRGDEVLGTLGRFAREQRVQGGHFAAIGALSSAVVAYWNPESREYEKIAVGEQVEVLALIGDVAIEGEETKVHAHIVLGKRDGSTIGGHLLKGTVYPTLEMHFVDAGIALERTKDPETKLSLIEIAEG
ncbi:MAG TPA: DUF296 domain-containing protein [Thermoanaerobaculia bacterium]|nr:DUF296 domain-containing protein [Thermoanaerobaculia bacterium]